MVKLDVSLLRFLEDEDFRVMTALEMTMRNHDLAPTALIERIAQLPHGGARKRLQLLLKHKFIHHENTVYDGYAMKYNAYDYLALRTFAKRGTVGGVGCRIGCGKESDIFLVEDENNNECVLKLQRLGRCSFRSVARNRDYKGGGKGRHGASWFYLSRLAAQKEYAFMKMLYDEGFPVPKPIDHNRHGVVMEYLKATLLNNINEMDQAQKVYERCLNLVVKLANNGLIHGDFNEFNLLVTDDLRVIMIDFPQMVSTDHKNAAELFDRDVKNLADFFQRRFRIPTPYFPKLANDVKRSATLDQQVAASGFFTKRQQQELEALTRQNDVAEASDDEDEEAEEGEEEEEEEQAPAAVPVKKPGAGRGQPIVSVSKFRDPNAIASDSDEDEKAVEEAQEEEPTKAPEAPAASSEAPKATKAPAEAEEAETEKKDGNDDDDDAASVDSEAERIADAKQSRADQLRRALEASKAKSGAGLDGHHIRNQVKRDARHKDNAEFRRAVHANSMKNRKARKLRDNVKKHADSGLFDGAW